MGGVHPGAHSGHFGTLGLQGFTLGLKGRTLLLQLQLIAAQGAGRVVAGQQLSVELRHLAGQIADKGPIRDLPLQEQVQTVPLQRLELGPDVDDFHGKLLFL